MVDRRAAEAQRPSGSLRSHVVPLACLAVFTVAWVLLAIDPRYRQDWLLENLPTFVFVPAAVLTYRRFRFSDRAYVQVTVFLILHTIGSHYTYSEVPAGDWIKEAFALARNHYDRLVHFSFGLLMLRPLRELAIRKPSALGRFSLPYLSVANVVLWSVAYELLEWLVASIADPTAGIAYLGTQGDVWDAQKDMALAALGGIIAATVEAMLTGAQRRDSTGRRSRTAP
jgi:putative membrane protein